MIFNKVLSPITYGYDETYYLQNNYELLKHTYNFKFQYDTKNIGAFYIYHIKMIEDIDYKFESLYTLTYVDLWNGSMHTIKNKTFKETVEEIRKTKLIFDEDNIEDFLYHAIFSVPKITINGEPFIINRQVDFKKEGLPMHEWDVKDGEWIIIDHDQWL